jgi:hypothetical protein
MVAENQPSGPPPVQHLSFTNNAGVVVRKVFIEYGRDSATADYKKSRTFGESLNINQDSRIDLSTLDDIKPLDLVRLRVDCVWVPKDPDPPEAIRYNKNGQTATYSLKGTTGNLWIEKR